MNVRIYNRVFESVRFNYIWKYIQRFESSQNSISREDIRDPIAKYLVFLLHCNGINDSLVSL